MPRLATPAKICRHSSAREIFLKLKPRGELQNARRISVGNLTESRAVNVENIAIFTRRAVYRRRAGRSTEISPVKEIEGFGAKLQSRALGKVEIFAQAEINRQEIRTVEESAFKRSGLTRRNVKEHLSRKCWITRRRSQIAARG